MFWCSVLLLKIIEEYIIIISTIKWSIVLFIKITMILVGISKSTSPKLLWFLYGYEKIFLDM
jgi:hypothetical protein